MKWLGPDTLINICSTLHTGMCLVRHVHWDDSQALRVQGRSTLRYVRDEQAWRIEQSYMIEAGTGGLAALGLLDAVHLFAGRREWYAYTLADLQTGAS